MHTKDELSLLKFKFEHSPKKAQLAFIDAVLENISPSATFISGMISILNGEKFIHPDGWKQGDKLYVDLMNVSCYPEPSKEYYENNNLLINDQYIELTCYKIDALTANISFLLYRDLTIECEVTIPSRYLIKKSDLNIL